jgi:flagellar FliL protein
LLVVILGGLAVGGGVGAFFAGPAIAARIHGTPAAADSAKAGKSAEGKGGKGEKGAEATRVLHNVDNIVLNPAGSGGTRFLMVNATFELKDAAAGELMKERDAEIRDALLGVLGRNTVEELTDMTHREKLKQDVIAAMGTLFPAGSFKRVYFSQFVVQ